MIFDAHLGWFSFLSMILIILILILIIIAIIKNYYEHTEPHDDMIYV